jgi:hypothetical protein
MPLLPLYATMACRRRYLLFSNKDKMYYILRPKRKEQENTTKMHARRFKFSPLHSAFYG